MDQHPTRHLASMGSGMAVLPWLLGTAACGGLLIWTGRISGAPSLATEPGAIARWASSVPIESVMIHIVRLAGSVLCIYLFAICMMVMAGSILRLPHLLRTAEALTIPALRPLLSGIIGVGLTASSVITLPAIATADPTQGQMVAGQGVATMELVGQSPGEGGDAPVTSTSAPAGTTTTTPTTVPTATIPTTTIPTTTTTTARDTGTAVMELVVPESTDDIPASAPAGVDDDATTGTTMMIATTTTTGATVPGSTVENTNSPAPGTSGGTTVPPGTEGTGGGGGPGASEHAWTIAPGDHLWHVSEVTLREHLARQPDNAEILTYLNALIDLNADVLAVRDNPSLVFTGQVFTLPEPTTDSTQPD